MEDIDTVRRFNRTVTQYVGALETEFLGSKRALGECRVLFEIGEQGIDLRELRDRLNLDSGYMSRLLRSLERGGLVLARPSKSDARVRALTLTKVGLRELQTLNSASNDRAESLLRGLNSKLRGKLISAMSTVDRLLTASSIKVVVEDPTTEAASQCVNAYYNELSLRFDQGFDPATSISADPEELMPPNGFFLVAKLHGEPIGCGALKLQGSNAEIKRMWVDSNQRGLGVGRRILQELETIAAGAGVSVLRLETNESLKEAQSLYRSSGFSEVGRFNDEPYAHHWFEKHIG